MSIVGEGRISFTRTGGEVKGRWRGISGDTNKKMICQLGKPSLSPAEILGAKVSSISQKTKWADRQEGGERAHSWRNYFRIGNSNRAFNKVRDYIERKVRKFVMRRKKLKGFGWKKWSREDIYEKWGLYNDYQIRYIRPKATPSR